MITVPSAGWTMTNEVIEGNEWAAYGALDTYSQNETRDHLQARAYGDRALVVLVGVTPHQGTWESHVQGEAAQVEAFLREGARDVRNLNRRDVLTGKPDDTETVLSGLGRGRWKRASDGTSPAAYFIALPLLKSKSLYLKQLLAILTQTRDCEISIVNTIEHAATFVLNLFGGGYPSLVSMHDTEDEETIMTPDNTIFVEYLPAGCFGSDVDHRADTFAIMNFSWEKVVSEHKLPYWQASNPYPLGPRSMWKSILLEEINDLVLRL